MICLLGVWIGSHSPSIPSVILLRRTNRINFSTVAAPPPDYFPYGVVTLKKIVTEGRFFVDKTKYIRELERYGKYFKIWRPRRFGKSMICEQLKLYYDKALPEEEVTFLVSKLIKSLHV